MSNTKGVNSTILKIQNRASILRTLKNLGSMSRKDLAEKIKLTPAAITIITNEMIEEKILVEKGVEKGEQIRAGRKKILIDINENYKYVVSIDITKEQVTLGIYNIKGKLKGEMKLQNNKGEDSKTIIKEVSNNCMKLLWQNNLTKEQVLGIGVSIVGLVDKEKGISKKAFGLWKEKVPLKELLEENIGVPVVVDNNVRTLAMAEIEMGSNRLINDLLFIKYGPGIGSALILNKHIHYGGKYLAGEIGHMTLDVKGNECRCGKKGCLETLASEEAIVANIKEIFSKEQTPYLYNLCKEDSKELTIELIGKRYPLQDQKANTIINKAIFDLALVISNVITFVDINKVVIYGQFFKNTKVFNELRRQLFSLKNDYQENCILEKSTLNDEDYLIGAYVIAIKELFYDKGGL